MGKLIFTGIKKVGQLQIKRILWIDATKVIGIWLVVLGHMNLPEYVVSPIFSFHMALFFFISGFLEKSDKITNTIIKGFRGLIIPYIFFYFISYFWWFNVSLSRHQEIYGNISIGSAIFKPLFGMLFGVGYCTKYSTMINVPLWFLVGLFAVKLIHHFILQICNNNIKKYLLLNIPIILVVYILKKNNIDLLFSLDSALLAFPFFGLGYFSQTTKKDFLNQFIDYKNNTILKISIIIVVFILLLTLSKYNGRVDINEFKYGKNIFVFYSNGFLGTILIICLSSFYRKQNNLATTISNGTIIIVAFHIYLSEILCKSIDMKGEGLIINPIIAGLLALITIVLMVFPIKFMEKHIPLLIGKKSKPFLSN